MNRSRLIGGIAAAALVLPLAAVAAPAASAADMGTTSLASVLTGGQQGFDQDYKDYDIVTAAVLAVLKAKPNSPVKVLTDGSTALTAFIPNDQAFMNLASALTKKKVTTEAGAFKAVASLGIPTVEKVLEYHVVPGATILSGDALKANGAKKVVAYCTHPVLSGPAVERVNDSDLDALVVTDTIPLNDSAAASPRIRQLSVAEIMAETIRRISNDDSVSSLFID